MTENDTLAGQQLFILSEVPPTLGGKMFGELPVTQAVALDPWMEPLPSSGPTPGYSASPPLLVVNSGDFTFWTEHFTPLRALRNSQPLDHYQRR